MNQSKSNSQFVWTKFLLLFGALVASISFVYLTWWSFGETREWFAFLDSSRETGFVSLALALVFQYGQGPVLYLRARFLHRHRELGAQAGRYGKPPSRDDARFLKYSEILHETGTAWYATLGFMLIFIAFAVVDGWTNIEQMWLGLQARESAGQLVGADKYIFTAVIGVVLVFVEELLGLSFSTAGNLLNDIRQIYGYRRLDWLDMFGRLTEEQLAGRITDRGEVPVRQPYTPAFHPAGLKSNGAGIPRKGLRPE